MHNLSSQLRGIQDQQQKVPGHIPIKVVADPEKERGVSGEVNESILEDTREIYQGERRRPSQ